VAGRQRVSHIAIVQHPRGECKQISIENNHVVYAGEHVVQYVTSTGPGSSGSPVLTWGAQVVALHHADVLLTEAASDRKYQRREAIHMGAILRHVRENYPAVYLRLNK
jgi:V8-like Glu-specific endopeptidase